MRPLGDERMLRLVQRYVAAWESRNVDELVAILTEDATFAMPPFPHWFRGRESVVAFIASTGRPDLRHVTTQANGQAAVGWYMWSGSRGLYLPTALEVLALRGERVAEITAFVLPERFPRFGLPTELPHRITAQCA